jgi:hypothetical protein
MQSMDRTLEHFLFTPIRGTAFIQACIEDCAIECKHLNRKRSNLFIYTASPSRRSHRSDSLADELEICWKIPASPVNHRMAGRPRPVKPYRNVARSEGHFPIRLAIVSQAT